MSEPERFTESRLLDIEAAINEGRYYVPVGSVDDETVRELVAELRRLRRLIGEHEGSDPFETSPELYAEAEAIRGEKP